MNTTILKRLRYCALLSSIALCGTVITAQADSGQQFSKSQTNYLEAAFASNVPEPNRVWIGGELKQKIEQVLQHRAGFLRSKYWQRDDTSVWILDEIGKERPITTGVTILHSDGISRIQDVQVLAYRESRGWEVKHAFFTQQFEGASLRKQAAGQRGLNKRIDGISGATLSVRALKKVAEIALILDQHVRAQTP